MATTRKPKRFVGTKSAKPSKPGAQHVIGNQIPSEILDDQALNAAIRQLPSNYSFEIHKTIHHVRKNNTTMVALQMPEGLQMFACTISDIVEQFTTAQTVIMGDVTYGACCIDDYTAVALGCDMLVHYGHSCLVPMTETKIKTLYVFVEISIDSVHLAESVRLNFPDTTEEFHRALLDSEEEDSQIPAGTLIGNTVHLRIEAPNSDPDGSSIPEAEIANHTRLALVSTIQFVAALQNLKEDLSKNWDPPSTPHSKVHSGTYEAIIPRAKPLSPGEILGCTAPSLNNVDAILYLGDGRFHLESIMIANPSVPAFRYDPYSKKLTRERYDHKGMRNARADAVQTARNSVQSSSSIQYSADIPSATYGASLWGIVLGTLGRQGNFRQLQALTEKLRSASAPIPYMPILLSELSPTKLALFEPYISTFIQTSCPRLSIDWGYAFTKPLLSPYEATLAIDSSNNPCWIQNGEVTKEEMEAYPMNFYTMNTPWALSRIRGYLEEPV